MKNTLKEMYSGKTARKDEETLFRKLAEQTRNLSLNEKILKILEVSSDERPEPPSFDRNYNCLYLINNHPVDWTTYALARIRALERNKKKGFYNSGHGSI